MQLLPSQEVATALLDRSAHEWIVDHRVTLSDFTDIALPSSSVLMMHHMLFEVKGEEVKLRMKFCFDMHVPSAGVAEHRLDSSSHLECCT